MGADVSALALFFAYEGLRRRLIGSPLSRFRLSGGAFYFKFKSRLLQCSSCIAWARWNMASKSSAATVERPRPRNRSITFLWRTRVASPSRTWRSTISHCVSPARTCLLYQILRLSLGTISLEPFSRSVIVCAASTATLGLTGPVAS